MLHSIISRFFVGGEQACTIRNSIMLMIFSTLRYVSKLRYVSWALGYRHA